MNLDASFRRDWPHKVGDILRIVGQDREKRFAHDGSRDGLQSARRHEPATDRESVAAWGTLRLRYPVCVGEFPTKYFSAPGIPEEVRDGARSPRRVSRFLSPRQCKEVRKEAII